ncbi:MAG: LysM peptidoglycan-binding domain-containing protein, partial [Bacteroidales bacterium]|nr:LysM peptidoglycan-binding domain-containing protein [Bacteroidales bacterium]
MLRRFIILLIPAIFAVCAVSAQVNVEISQEKVLENGQKFYLHTVQQGQTLYSICKAYSAKEKDVLNANPELQSGTLSIGQIIKIPIENEISKDGKYIVYTVKKGETLYSLLKRFETTEKEFYEANPKLSRNESIRAGDEIYFPVKEKKNENVIVKKPEEEPKQNVITPRDETKYIYHTVAKGETLYKLTKQYDISLDELVAENPSLADRPLSIGETIRVPRKQIALVKQEENNKEEKNEEPEHYIRPVNSENAEVAETEPDTMVVLTDKKDFSIALLMSFETEANLRDLANQEKRKVPQKIRTATERAVDFYSGCLVALENFRHDDVNIRFKAYDIGKDNTILTTMVGEGKLDNVDMIIGPAYKSQVDYLNSLNLGIPMLLPFVTDENVLKSNPNNIMLNPSKQDIRNEVAKYASSIANSNALIIKGTSDDSKVAASKYVEAMQNVGVKATELNFNGSSIEALGSALVKGAENLIIMTFENEMTATRVLSQVFKLCNDYKITLIADPRIMNYESIDPNYYVEVRYTYYSDISIDYKNLDVKTFISRFHNAFLCEPNTDAYIAADAINYFVPLMQKAGKTFAGIIDQNYVQEGLGGKRQYVKNSGYSANSYSNKEVYLYTIQKDYSFSIVYPTENSTDNKYHRKEMGALTMTVQLLLALSLLVVIHEFGHYLAARAFGVRVKKFYLFFDFPMFFTAPTFALFRAKKVNGKWKFSWFSRNAPKEFDDDETTTEWGIGY